MKVLITLFIGFGSLIYESHEAIEKEGTENVVLTETDLKNDAFQILNAKCNVCHRKQNPFMVFSMRNMQRRALKIYQQVFVQQRMPKGDQTKLTNEEYKTLNNWLQTQLK